MSNLIGKASAAVKRIGSMREAMVHNIWLAGLGAYAKSAEEVSGLSAKSQSLFEELIARGKEVEQSTKEKVADVASDTSGAIEQRVNHLMQKAAGLDVVQLKAMDKKLDDLTKQVDALLAKEKKPVAKKAPAKRTVAKKPAVKPAAKPAAKAPATVAKKAVRPAAKKPAAKPAPAKVAEAKAPLKAVPKPAPKPAVARPAAKKPTETETA